MVGVHTKSESERYGHLNFFEMAIGHHVGSELIVVLNLVFDHLGCLELSSMNMKLL